MEKKIDLTQNSSKIMEIVYRKLSDIKPNPKNPRKAADKDSIRNLAESIKNNPRFFEARPILLSDRTGEFVIIGGERRSEAAALLGLEDVPTILFTGLTEEQEDEIMVRDNTHSGVWDEKKLKLIADKWSEIKIKRWAQQDGKKWFEENQLPTEFDAPPKNAPFVCKITFPDAGSMTKFVNEYKTNLEKQFGCTISESGGEL